MSPTYRNWRSCSACPQTLRNKYREELAERDHLSEARIDEFVHSFTEDVKHGRWQGKGWPEISPIYNVSKAAVNAYVTVLDRALRARQREGQASVTVDSFCPGFTKTDMTDGKGNEDVAGAVKTGVWLALRPSGELSGKFWADGQPLGWD